MEFQNKLIVHIGLPKTATTTLQECLFVGLHDMKYINYLGGVTDREPEIYSEFKKIAKSLFHDTVLLSMIMCTTLPNTKCTTFYKNNRREFNALLL